MPQIVDSDVWVDHDALNERFRGKAAMEIDEVT